MILGSALKYAENSERHPKSKKNHGISKINSTKKTKLDNMKMNNYYSTKVNKKSKWEKAPNTGKKNNENEVKEIDEFIEIISLIKYVLILITI